ncbi:hypothetical protein LSAT2_002196 [Lamellibrachia satsuma]|nr:hypothetical protein LSAT2_002196 [Lamellibrachia satsuma]
MVRSRSRSPRRKRDHKRSRSRSPRDKERRHRHRRERSRSPRRRRSRSPPPRRSRSRSPRRKSRSPPRKRHRTPSEDRDSNNDDCVLIERPEIDESQLEGKTPDEIEMMKVMGFAGFDTTKGKHVNGNDVYVANIVHKRKYRQYMNRRGGFNRPLDFIA